jgi:hypothetical protein
VKGIAEQEWMPVAGFVLVQPDERLDGASRQLGHDANRLIGRHTHRLASNDLIDMMHEHPLLADGGPQMEFEVVFPRPGVYRVWIQVQSDNTVNTVHFDVPVGIQANLEPVTESQ